MTIWAMRDRHSFAADSYEKSTGVVASRSALPPGGKEAYLDFGLKLVFDIILFAITSYIFS